MKETDARQWMPRTAGIMMVIIGWLDIVAFIFLTVIFIAEVSGDWYMMVPLVFCLVGVGVGFVCFHGGLSVLQRKRWVYALVASILTGLSCVADVILLAIVYLGNGSGNSIYYVLPVVFILIVVGGLQLIFILESRKQFTGAEKSSRVKTDAGKKETIQNEK